MNARRHISICYCSATLYSEATPAGWQTIGQAFAKASANSVQLPLLEVSEARGFAINNYDSQNIRNTLDHHLSELKRKRLSIPAVDEGFVQVFGS